VKKYSKAKTKNRIRILSIFLFILVVILAIIIFQQRDKETIAFENDEAKMETVEFNLGEELLVTKVGSYSGAYMEDASDEEVTDVMAIMLTNTGDKTLQYAEVTLYGKDEEAVFAVTTLKPHTSMLVLESTRKEYADKYTEASVQNVVFFEKEPSIYEDVFEVQPLDGGFNITNISEKDVEEEVIIYFKDCMNDIYYGGITYRGRIEGGLKSGEIRQIMTDNFSASDTEVMFITIAGK